MRIYLASPFFNDKELDYYKKVLNILEKKNLTVYAPLKNEISRENKTKEQWAKLTFSKDVEEINKADAVVMLFYGLYSDSGTSWECGYAFAMNKPVVVVHLHEGKSNCMINCGSYSNLKGLQELENYDFDKMPIYNYYNTYIIG
jgi:nucleoside 2-deoxyribosyltransferase